jgi:hypothetical protein
MQPDLFLDDPSIDSSILRSGSSISIDPLDATFRDSGRAPLHSWFPYLEGYSPRFVDSVRQEFLPDARRILEPFAGSGTTPIVLGQSGVECGYSEANPAMAFVVQTKLKVLALDSVLRSKLGLKIARLKEDLRDRVMAAKPDTELLDSYVAAFGNSVFFDEPTLNNITLLRSLNDDVKKEDPLLGECLTLAALASLIPASRLKRAGDLRFKSEKELLAGTPCIIDAVAERLFVQSHDLPNVDGLLARAHFACPTAGELYDRVGDGWDGVITSPPYLNGTNYIRNARLELWYDRHIASKADLRRLRDGVITSGINDVDFQTDWRPVSKGVERVVAELEREAYDQRIAKMVGGYFRDMEVALKALSSCLNSGARLCIDIGDSIYAGIHVPTDDLLVEVANGLGLQTIERIHLRKRISKCGKPVRQQLLVFEK